jgi:hypothetical protein
MTTLTIRNLVPGAVELNFVRSSWLRSAWDDYDEGKRAKMPFADFREYHTRYMLEKVTNHTVRVIEFDDINEVLGYAVVDEFRGVCHWVYVKHDFRRQHLASALLGGVRYFSTGSKPGYKLADALKIQVNPYLR